MADIKRVETPNAPAAIGPYSQGISANGFVWTAGQIPLDPKTGELVQGDIATQTKRVMESLKAILEEAGASLQTVVKTTVFLKSMDSFVAMNDVYGRPEYFGDHKPARSTVQAAKLPRDVNVEIEAVALVR